MIKDYNHLREILEKENKLYIGNKGNYLKLALLKDHDYLIWKYVKALRYTEFHFNNRHKIRYYIWQRIKNKRGAMLGITMWHNTIGAGVKIWHYGSIIVNGNAKIGENCQFHGENCIGNKGDFNKEAPIIGNNVDLGVGAKIIGPVEIADNVKIGANAVVTKSCHVNGAVLVGIPAREVK